VANPWRSGKEAYTHPDPDADCNSKAHGDPCADGHTYPHVYASAHCDS
jgi:hypothetical protein